MDDLDLLEEALRFLLDSRVDLWDDEMWDELVPELTLLCTSPYIRLMELIVHHCKRRRDA